MKIMKDSKIHYSIMDLLSLDPKNEYKTMIELNVLDTFNQNQYEYFVDSIWETILNDFRIKNKPVIVYLNGRIVRIFTIAEIYILSVLLKPNIVYKKPIEIEDICTTPNLTSNQLHDLIEQILQRFKIFFDDKKIDYEELANIAADIVEKMTKLSILYSWLAPTSFSLYDIIQFAKRNHTFNQLINMRVSDDMSVKEIEDLIPVVEKQLIDVILQDKKNCLYQYVVTDTVSHSQFRQMFTFVGPRIDVDKIILPYPIKGNFLNGLQDIVEEYAEAVVARNALIDKDKHIKTAGYESRKIDLNCLDTMIDSKVKDCKTKHYLTIFVETEADLKRLKFKYQIMPDGKLREINPDKDKHLIGTSINIRSHVVCALKNKKVCQTCFGSNAPILKGIRIGAFPSTQIQNVMSNKTISSKHYLDTNSAVANSKTLNRFFQISRDRLFLKTDMDYSRVKLVIDKLYYENLLENINNSDEEDYDATPLENIYIEESIIDKKTGEIVSTKHYFDDLVNIYLYLSNEILDEKGAIKNTPTSETVEIHFNKIDLITPIIDLRMRSEDIVYQVGRFIDLIDSKYTSTYTDPNLFMKDLLEIMREVKISTHIQHLETLMYNSIKDANDLSHRPDFSKKDINVQFLSVKESIMLKDVYTSISFEKYNNQLKNINFFKRGSETGVFHSFFRTTKKLF